MVTSLNLHETAQNVGRVEVRVPRRWIGTISDKSGVCKNAHHRPGFNVKKPGMSNVKNGVFVDVLSHADLVICSVTPSGRKVGPSFCTPTSTLPILNRFRDATTRVQTGFQQAT